MGIYRVLFGVFSVIAGLLAVVAVRPEARAQLRGTLRPDYRKVVSVAEGDLSGEGRLWKVVKVETRDSLWLEIYQTTEDGLIRMAEKLNMPDRRDGYFNFQGQSSNLAIDDIDKDGKLEILSPSFNSELVGKLDIYKFEPLSQSLRMVVQ